MPTRKRKARELLEAEHVMPWERQQDESTPAWQAFEMYRNMGAERSTGKVQRTVGKSKRLIDGWSSKHDWVRRVAAWDREQDRIARKAQLDGIREMNKRHAKIAMGGLSAVVHSLRRYIPTESNPNPPPMSDQLMAQMVKICAGLERVARDQADSIQEHRQNVTAKVTVEEERASMRKMLSDPEALLALQTLADKLDS